MNSVFIPFNTPSSKNSNQMGKTGGLFKSSTVRKYLQKLGVAKYSCTKKEYENYKGTKNNPPRPNLVEAQTILFKSLLKGNPPYYIEFTFIRDNQKSFDLINACQIVQDLMVAHGWIEDDNFNFLIPVFNNKTTVDKQNAGVIITPLNK